jgi:glucose-6-phosphate 1-dehydrogenase
MTEKSPKLEPTILVIFGITGDLAKRKLLPALYHLIKDGLLHEHTEIVGITRGNLTLDELLVTIELCVNEADGLCDPEIVTKLKSHLQLRTMDVTNPEEYNQLRLDLDKIEDRYKVHMNRLFYLSIPPNVSQSIITALGEHGMNTSCQHGAASTRLLVEKPFGYDLESAKQMLEATATYFGEDQIFRIDHYLAKETVQNILAFRFNNPIFESIWNNKHVAYIEIIANEKLGIEGRVGFYEPTGALRDLIQNHLLQVLAIVTLEQPMKDSSDSLHEAKIELFKSIRAISPDQVIEESVRGQYEHYSHEVSNPNSLTETYAAVRLFIDNKRWQDVPMIVRTGKAMKNKLSCVRVVFKPLESAPHHNVLTFRLQPNEGIEISLRVKRPGFENDIQPVEMDFDYKRSFNATNHPDAYERVLVDAVRGDHTLFAAGEEIIESWRVVQAVILEWSKSDNGLQVYEKNGHGPDLPKSWNVIQPNKT